MALRSNPARSHTSSRASKKGFGLPTTTTVTPDDRCCSHLTFSSSCQLASGMFCVLRIARQYDC